MSSAGAAHETQPVTRDVLPEATPLPMATMVICLFYIALALFTIVAFFVLFGWFHGWGLLSGWLLGITTGRLMMRVELRGAPTPDTTTGSS